MADPTPSWVDVADAASLAENKGRSIEVRGRRFALFKVGGEFRAIDDACPHRGAPLGAGWVENGEVFCPLHGWAFNVSTGACSTRSDRPVRSYPVKVEDGRVWLGL